MSSTAPIVLEERKQISEAAEVIQSKTSLKPRVGVICGTGMGALANRVKNAVKISYDQIPYFPLSTVETHHGNLLLGQLGGQNVCLMQGRFHYYEGYNLRQVTFPVRVMKALGCELLIVMNAVGSMNQDIPRGSLVFIEDFINMMGVNPLFGANDDALGPRFPDMFEPYCHQLIALGEDVAMKAGIRTHRGVLIGVTGPNLETRAEYRAFRLLGADIIGMSTVPETIVAVHQGMKVLGISTVTDNCFPEALGPANIAEIIETAQNAEPKLDALVSGILERLNEVAGK